VRTVPVALGNRSYDIVIGNGLLNDLGIYMSQLQLGSKVLLVTDTNVGPLYGKKVLEVLTRANFQVTMVEVPAGETTKTLEQAARLYDAAFDHELDRSSPVVVLGGGVVGDLAGFVAATYMRGVPFIQVPTTLLAQVDSSVGGKVAVNHPRGKNIIGAFYQPKMVLIDLDTLKTLALRELRAGLAEVIKYGVIWDADFFAWLEENMAKVLNREPEALGYVIETCCKIKAAVVEQDETEQGRRAILNYGHTVGHALESITNYQRYLHGEAVAVGMVLEAHLACETGLLAKEIVIRIQNLVSSIHLPVSIPTGLSIDDMIKSMYTDKKVTQSKLTFALPTSIGVVEIIRGVTESEIFSTLTECLTV